MLLKSRFAYSLSVVFAVLTAPIPAYAQLPDPVRAMIEAAIATGDPKKVETVAEIAGQTNPGETAEIDALVKDFDAKQQRLAAEKAARKETEPRSASLFQNWRGKGEIGGSRSTGNSSDIGVSAGLTLERRGIDWRHKLSAQGDYQRSNGTTTTEQFRFAYEPSYTINDGLFAYGLSQYERDRFQGYAHRVSLSGGLGYRAIDKEGMHLSIKAGPAWRWTSLIPNGRESTFAGHSALDFDWRFAPTLKLTQQASTYFQSNNSSFNSTTGLEAKLNGNLAARVSYSVEYDTDPPVGAVKTDTLSRFTLIYDF